MATTTKADEYKTPHVHEAIGRILESLSVAKGGTLPGNMGGKPYITAVDASAEVKRKFVEHDLIFLPNESIFHHKEVINKDRINVLIAITGTYTIVSTRDGSQVTVSGTGDGLAGGTAVASNIASTNALKNALLRTFLITEQSVEDAAKNGDEQKDSATQQKIARAATPPRTAAAKPEAVGPKDTIRLNWIETGKVTKEAVNDKLNAHKAAGKSGEALWSAILKDLEAGK